jgi:hypothetical protein
VARAANRNKRMGPTLSQLVKMGITYEFPRP